MGLAEGPIIRSCGVWVAVATRNGRRVKASAAHGPGHDTNIIRFIDRVLALT